jgi:hypothetical protein
MFVKIFFPDSKMAKAKLKTEETKSSVKDFLNAMKDEQKRKDSFTILSMMEKASGDKAKMWGGSIVGFGNVELKYASGRELDWFKMGFSPRKQSLTLYGVISTKEQASLLKKLGKYKTGVGCLYINTLEDVDTKVLEEMIKIGCGKK